MANLMTHNGVQCLLGIDVERYAVLCDIAVDRFSIHCKAGFFQLRIVGEIKKNTLVCRDFCNQIDKFVCPSCVIQYSAVNCFLNGLLLFGIVLCNVSFKSLASFAPLVVAFTQAVTLDQIKNTLRILVLFCLQRILVGIFLVLGIQFCESVLLCLA